MAKKNDSPTTDPPAAPVTPPASTPPVSPPVIPGLDPAVYCVDDGKTWKSKFHGESGRRQQIEARLDQQGGLMEQQVADLTGEGTQKDAEIARLKAELAAAQQQVGGIPALQTQIVDLSQQAERAARLSVLMQYPDLLAYQVTETQQGDEGDPVEITVRPFLDLIENTTLEGEALEVSLKRLATALNVQKVAAPPDTPPDTPPVSPVAPGAPPAPAPADDDGTPGYWRKKAMEWHGLKLLGKPGPGGEDAAAEEAKCWDQMRQVIQKEQAQA